MEIELLRGERAMAVLGDSGFIRRWLDLWKQCPWATLYQSPGFVGTWYRVYGRPPVEPILAVGWQPDQDNLVGLMAWAWLPRTNELVVAGRWHAEYQCWISTPEAADAFAWGAIRAARDAMPGVSLSFRYLPPGIPLGWLSDTEAHRLSLLRMHRRPLLSFGDGAEIEASLRKSGNKSRLRQMRKLGAVEFRRLGSAAELTDVLDQIADWHDARRLAVDGSTPFRHDPLKKPFHLALMEAGLVHATVLTMGGDVASAHLNFPGKREVHMSLMAYRPQMARFSPGKLHMLYLSRMLLGEGYDRLDLTPGGEAYKGRFANAWDQVSSLEILPTPHARRINSVCCCFRDAAKSLLRKARIDPARAESIVQSLQGMCPLRLAARTIVLAAKRARSGAGKQLYWIDGSTGAVIATPDTIRRDAIDDLLAYYHWGPGWPSRRQFMADAMRRLEAGEHAYTYAEGGILLHVGWLVEQASEQELRPLLPAGAQPPTGQLAIAKDLCTFPIARRWGLATLSLRAMAHDAALAGATRILAVIQAHDDAARYLVEKVGFRSDPWAAAPAQASTASRPREPAARNSPRDVLRGRVGRA